MFALSRCLCVESFNPEHTYTYTGLCVVTKKPYSVTVKASELYAYHQGKLAQDAFKSLSAADREFLISGTSPEGWKLIFPEEEDDEEDEDSQ